MYFNNRFYKKGRFIINEAANPNHKQKCYFAGASGGVTLKPCWVKKSFTL